MTDAEYFEVYGAAATLGDPTVSAGRHSFQREAEELIASDVARKLRLKPSDRLLEVGCGPGVVLRPLAERVGVAVGVDHPAVLAAFDPVPGNVELVAGHWPAIELDGDFDKVLAYSVLHYLGEAERAVEFIDGCVAVTRPDGWVMLGDLPNRDAADRFAATAFGQRFLEDWRRRVAAEKSADDLARDALFAAAPKLDPFITDVFVLTLVARYRKRGHEVYVVPQEPELPFSHTREDILIHVRP